MIFTKFDLQHKLLSVFNCFPLLSFLNRLSAIIFLSFMFPVNYAFAQITSDSTLPNNSTIKIDGNTSIIEGGTRSGNNLFHSFQEFSVPTGSTAFFNNALDIQNILSRITGQSVSNIDGLIRNNGHANLFLINPNGIIFGPNASLNIGGSFLASTASTIKFLDGKEFNTFVTQQTPLLTISTPIGLQFGGNLGTIENQSIVTNSSGKTVGLQVQPERTLALVGGNIRLNGGSLQAPNGRVELAAVAPQETVGLVVNSNNISLNVPKDLNKADVSLTNVANIDVVSRGQGSVEITARNIDISGNSKISAGIGQGLISGNSPSGNITLNASREVNINYPSRLTNIVAKEAVGKSGDIIINADTINIDNRKINNWASPTTQSFVPSALETGVLGQGYAGNISLFATNSINLLGQDINAQDKVISTFIFEELPKGGRYYGQHLGGGDITLHTHGSISLKNAFLDASGGYGGKVSVIGDKSVSITENSFINAGTATGDSKNITVRSNGHIAIQRSRFGHNVGDNPFSNAGNIAISGKSVSITEGSLLETQSEDSNNSGNIYINALEKVEISGIDVKNRNLGDRAPGYENTVLTTRSREGARGKAGDITMTAGEILINNGERTPHNTEVMYPSLDAGGDGQGPSGNISLFATGSISLIGQDVRSEDLVISTFSDVEGRRGGGDVFLQANGFISLKSAYIKTARSDGGNILLNGREAVSVTKNSFLNSGSTQGKSGDITIQSNGPVTIQRSWLGNNVGSSPRASDAGNIDIRGRSVYITEGSLLETKSERNGANSGKIQIHANEEIVISGKNSFVGQDTSRTRAGILRGINQYTALTTTSEDGSLGQAGNIRISARSLEVSNGASLTAISRNAFEGGNIVIDVEQLKVTNGGQLITDAENSGNAGNIDIETKNLLLLRRGAQIKATAENSGNGGNITIKAKRGFIVAVPGENSDIIANALNGNGGKITIHATGIFGMTPRSREDLVKLLGTNDPAKLDPSRLLTNDISAISQANPLLNGVVTINTPDVDPSRGLVQLPTNLVDASQQIAQGCTPKHGEYSRFVATGRGGVPLNPREPLRSRAVMSQWMVLDEQTQEENVEAKTSGFSEPPTDDDREIVEANRWVVDERGNVHLIARVPNTNASFQNLSSSFCRTPS
jgi:filamentous hemagglutinin family protein